MYKSFCSIGHHYDYANNSFSGAGAWNEICTSLFPSYQPGFPRFLCGGFSFRHRGCVASPDIKPVLSTELKVRPLWVGLFYTVNAIAGITVSFLLAKRSDLGDRRKLILICYLMAVGNCLLFAFNRDYLTLITLGVLMASVANTAMPQIFALAREYADNSAREVVMFSSIMRAQLSLAWVIGPPLSFMLALNYGFTLMFSIAAGIFVISALVVWFILPSVKQPEPVADAPWWYKAVCLPIKCLTAVHCLNADVDV